jgi:transcriptional regulator with XRE-family HTH domain
MQDKRPSKVTDQLRQIVENCGQTRYQIAKATGITEATLCRLVSGERFLSPKALDTLAEYLGLELRPVESEWPEPERPAVKAAKRPAKRRTSKRKGGK